MYLKEERERRKQVFKLERESIKYVRGKGDQIRGGLGSSNLEIAMQANIHLSSLTMLSNKRTCFSKDLLITNLDLSSLGSGGSLHVLIEEQQIDDLGVSRSRTEQ